MFVTLTSLLVLSCAFSTLESFLSSDERAWITLVSITGLPALSEETGSSRKELTSIPDNGSHRSPHDLDLELVGSIGNFKMVAQLVLLLVEHVLNPILFSSRVSSRSWVEAEVT